MKPFHLDKATEEQLMSLPGIAQAGALKILQYLRNHGSFTSIRQLQKCARNVNIDELSLLHQEGIVSSNILEFQYRPEESFTQDTIPTAQTAALEVEPVDISSLYRLFMAEMKTVHHEIRQVHEEVAGVYDHVETLEKKMTDQVNQVYSELNKKITDLDKVVANVESRLKDRVNITKLEHRIEELTTTSECNQEDIIEVFSKLDTLEETVRTEKPTGNQQLGGTSLTGSVESVPTTDLMTAPKTCLVTTPKTCQETTPKTALKTRQMTAPKTAQASAQMTAQASAWMTTQTSARTTAPTTAPLLTERDEGDSSEDSVGSSDGD